ncbi:TPA: DUF551 domain-containing protein [Klebsiella pneumoniae]|nr:DUF551 domain-containing protein [Klebsiella pneumoniae]
MYLLSAEKALGEEKKYTRELEYRISEMQHNYRHAQPAQVILDGWTCNDKANAALMMLDRIETADPVDDDRIDGIKRIVSELVAATQPQNSPQNIPEIIPGWIPVSERMPDETQPVIVVSEGGVVQRTVYQFCEGVWSDWYGMYDDVNVEAFTHWMPLPAAPQEVKGE